MTAAVAFESVTKTWLTAAGAFTALNDVDFSIEDGEFFGLLGPNGAGKTTLISILAGLVRASGGRVLVRGLDVQKDAAAARRLLGVVPQELVFDPFFTVRETLRIQSGYFGIRRNDDWIDELLFHLGLADKAGAGLRQLSGGMKRRVLVAQALVHRPPIIVLDEPTAGVDVELRQSLWQFIAGLNRQGHTVLLTTHYLEEAEALCRRIAMLKQGRVVALERTEQLLQQVAGTVLRFRIVAGALPPQLQAAVLPTMGDMVQLPVQDAAGIEATLAALRQAGVQVEGVEVRHGDLEDVFLRLMSAPAARCAVPVRIPEVSI